MQSDEKPFPSALFNDGENYPIHLIELMMRRVSYTIRCACGLRAAAEIDALTH